MAKRAKSPASTSPQAARLCRLPKQERVGNHSDRATRPGLGFAACQSKKRNNLLFYAFALNRAHVKNQ